MIENQKWIVRWETGKEMCFVPYDSTGMSSFICQGLSKGKVTINDREVELNDENITGWSYKE